MKICNYGAVIEALGRVDMAAIRKGTHHQARISGCVSAKQKREKSPPFLNSALLKTNAPTNAGFSMAVCKYGRDNQPNAASGFATRTCAGGNGGLYHRASAGASSLFGQAFKPYRLRIVKSVIAVATDGSARTVVERSSAT